MNNRIKKLPVHIANQIAAGEVVERPASVLKELLENSIDAGSTNIHVTIKNGGISLIKVADDGVGIEKADLELALMQHATSKISTTEDLLAIDSLGFRGEALASIASVSKFEIVSKPKTQNTAWKLITSELGCYAIEPAAHLVGTTVIMRDLFFNTPARKHFLRSEKTEYYHLEEVFKRVALSNLNIGFKLEYNDNLIYKLPSFLNIETKNKRISKIFGNSFFTKAIVLESSQKQDDANLSFFGLLQNPAYAKAQAMQQYFYINNRMIKDKLISHAIKQAYQNITGDIGKIPNYCLYLTLNSTEFDINVHPTKHEVRFRNSRLIHNFITTAIVNALQDKGQSSSASNSCAKKIQSRMLAHQDCADMTRNYSVPLNNLEATKVKNTYPFKKYIIDKQDSNQIVESVSGANKKNHLNINCLHIIEEKIAFVLIENKVALVDIAALVTDFIMTSLNKEFELIGQVTKAKLLFPHSIHLGVKSNDTYITKILKNLGFDLEFVLGGNWIIRAIPKILMQLNFSLEELMQQLFNKSLLQNDAVEKQYISKIATLIASDIKLSKLEFDNLISIVLNNSKVSNEQFGSRVGIKHQAIKYVAASDLRKLIKSY